LAPELARNARLAALAAGLLAGASASAQCLRFVDDIAPAGAQSLNGLRALAIGSGGTRLYAVMEGLERLAALAIDPATGVLSVLDVEQDGANGVDGMDGVAAVAVSPDGRHVYVAGSADDGIAIFATGAADALSFLAAARNGQGGVSNLAGPVDLAPSPDGRHLYAIAGTSQSVVAFSRNASTGALTFVQSITDASNVDLALTSPSAVTVSPDGDHVYVTSSGENAVSWFERDAGDGTLAFAGVARDGVGGVDGLLSARDVVVSPDGASVYASGRNEDEIAIFSRNSANGSLAFQAVVANGVDGVTGLTPGALAISRDGRELWAISPASFVGFQRDPATGALRFVEVRADGGPPEDLLSGASSLAVAPDGRHLFVGAAADGAVTTYERPALLRVVDVERDGANGVDGLLAPAFVAPSPDGRHVYAAGFQEDAIAAFARDPATGALGFVEFERNGVGGVTSLDGPSGIALPPDGKQLYVTGLFSDAVVTFTRNTTTGALAFASVLRDGFGGVTGIDGANAILVSPDGAHVYVGGLIADAVAIFSRHPTTGALTFVDAIFDGVDAEGLAGAGGAQMAMDALGEHLYVPANDENALSVLERDPATGLLDEILVLRDDADTPYLAFAFNALLSPDDAILYATGFLDDAITSFVRDPGFGALDDLEYERNGFDGVTGLEQPRGLALSEKGDVLVAAAQLSDSVVAFDHDLAFGSTTFAAVATDGACGYTDLDSPSAVATVGDHFYVTASNSNALVVLTPEPAHALTASAALGMLWRLARRRRS